MTTIADRYLIERELGRGGMATVMLARDLVHDRQVAIKLLRPELASAVSHERFLREMRLTAHLQHAHIVPLYDSGVLDGVPFYVMPYLEGESLRARLDREKQLPVAEAVEIATDVANALTFAHSHGVVHRDIKPENILLSGGQALIADFGIARAVVEAASDRLTSTGLAVGTPAYMSPEQASGEHDVDARTDIYSLGCVLFEMLAGIPPFVGSTPQAVIARRLSSNAPPVRELRSSVPDNVAQAVARALERVPADRYRTADRFAAALVNAGVAQKRRGTWRRWGGATIAAAAIGAAAVLGARWKGRTFPNVTSRVAMAREAAFELRLPEALHQASSALSRRPADPEANLWMAQVGALVGDDSAPSWRHAARIALAGQTRLDSADRLRAAALAALASDNLGEARDSANRLVTLAPNDLPALVLLADCIARDDVVVRDPHSPSGWRFRSSVQSAVRLYRQLIQEFPAVAPARDLVYSRLSGLLVTSPNVYQPGRSVTAPDSLFGGFAAIQGDTLVYVPFPLSELGVGGAGAHASASAGGLTRARTILRAVAAQWAHDFPKQALAHKRFAEVLESTGEILPTAPDVPSAISELSIARRLLDVRDSSDARLRFAIMATRLAVKTDQFGAARALADTVFATWRRPSAAEAGYLSPLAALTGRLAAAVALSRIDTENFKVTLPEGREYRVPAALALASNELFALAVVGGSADSVRVLRGRLERLLPAYTSVAERPSVRSALLGRPLSMAVPVIGAGEVLDLDSRHNYLVRLEQRVARRDSAGVQKDLRVLERLRRGALPGATSLDATYIEAWARASVGDSLAAAKQLDETLNALPTISDQLLVDAAVAGSLPRMMLLRVQVGARTDPTRLRWAGALCELWKSADAFLQSERARMCGVGGRQIS